MFYLGLCDREGHARIQTGLDIDSVLIKQPNSQTMYSPLFKAACLMATALYMSHANMSVALRGIVGHR